MFSTMKSPNPPPRAAEEDLVKAQKEIAAGAERALKRLDRMKQESVARTAEIGTDAKENLTGLSDQVAALGLQYETIETLCCTCCT